jgi:predicted nucleic acid-binding protein
MEARETRLWAVPPAAIVDLMIAAVAYCRNASVVTRNTADFEACGVAIVNPWNWLPVL